MNLQGEKTSRASQQDMGWRAQRTCSLLPVAGKVFLLTLPFIERACNDWSSQLPCGRVGNYPATGLWESTATDPWLRESKQTLPNLRTWAPCCVLCLITSAAIRADLIRVFRVGHSIMDGFRRQLAGIPNTLINIAKIVSGFDSHRPLHKPS